MAIDCRDEIGVKRSCRIVLVGSMALANEVVFASPPVGVIGGTDATGAETGYAIAEVKTVKTKTSTKNNAQARPVEMTMGEVLDLNALLSQEEIEAVRSWSSDGTETAAVSPEGVVTAMQPGEAAVTAILEDDEAIEFTITVREDGIVLLDIGEGDLALDLDEDVLGDVETNFEIGEM